MLAAEEGSQNMMVFFFTNMRNYEPCWGGGGGGGGRDLKAYIAWTSSSGAFCNIEYDLFLPTEERGKMLQNRSAEESPWG